MKVLGIGYGRHLFDTENFEHQRLKSCAGAVESFDHIVFTHKKDGLQKVTVGNFTIHPTNSNSKFSMLFDAVAIGQQIIIQKSISVITAQDVFETGFVGLRLKKKHPSVQLQVQEHGDVLSSKHWRAEKFSNRARYAFAMHVLKYADIIRVVSERTKVFLQDKLGAAKKIHTFPVVIDSKNFVRADNNYAGDTDTFTFITAARFVPQKNFPLMLQAFATTYKKHSHIRLKIFGEGPLKTDIETLIKKLELKDAVSVTGWTNDLGKEMQKADAYLLSSNYEGWGRVLIEAMVLGLPVVTTDVGCVGEVLIDEKHGLVTPVDNESVLSAAIERIVADTVLYSSIKKELAVLDIQNLPGTNMETYPQDWALTLQ